MFTGKELERVSRELGQTMCVDTSDSGKVPEVIEALANLDKSLNVNRCTYYYLNLAKNSYEYVSPNVYDITKIPAKEFNEHGLTAFISRVHKEDAQIIVEQVIPKIHSLWREHGKRTDNAILYTSFNYRICNKDDRYIHLLDESSIRGYTQEGEPLWLLGAAYQNPDFAFRGITLNAFYKDAEGRAHQVFHKRYPRKNLLTDREVEMLTLFKIGKTSKELAGELHLSVHTINTHRQNILKKLETTSIMEAIFKAEEFGLI